MERARLIDLVRATGCAVERGGFFFLCDPRWGAAERALAESAMAASVAVAPATGAEIRDRSSEIGDGKCGIGTDGGRRTEDGGRRTEDGGRRTEGGLGWLGVPTGGTSGGVKFARHDERTLTAAARGFGAHFGLGRVNAVDVLPASHVSGLMARVRCAETGGTHLAWDWKRLEAGDRPELSGATGEWVTSLVPTQLQRLLGSEAAVAWLRGFALVAVGGGPVWGALADEAASRGLRVALSYGMTETAAMVAALRPEEFLAGARSSGRAMPHARIEVAADGAISIAGESVFRGYFPETRAERVFTTQDEGRFDEQGRLHVWGRRDAVIITGGEKVNPAEVEAALRESGELADVAVLGVPDAQWGAAVVACYPAGGRAPDWAKVEARLRALAPYKRPKRFIAIADWPRNAQGKVNRARLAAAVGG